jgi:hypothetical protein
VSLDADGAWLRRVLVRQFAFRAAAWVERRMSPGGAGPWRAAMYDAFGSDRGLAALARLQAVKRRWAGAVR